MLICCTWCYSIAPLIRHLYLIGVQLGEGQRPNTIKIALGFERQELEVATMLGKVLGFSMCVMKSESSSSLSTMI